MYRVALVDDHTVVRQGLARIVERAEDLVLAGEAASGPEAVALVEHEGVDLAVLDLDMPGGGLALITRLRELHPGLRILVLSQHEERTHALPALRAGAHGYLTKQADFTTVESAMRRVASGRRYLSEAAQDLALEQLSSPDGAEAGSAHLTSRELEILRQLAVGRRVTDIAVDLGISVKTVSTHRSNMLGKLGLATNVDLALYARENGLV